MATGMPKYDYDDPNPYRAPAETDSLATERPGDASLAELNERVRALERIVAESWFLRPSTLHRAAATFGYWLIGYFCIGLVVAGIALLISLLLG